MEPAFRVQWKIQRLALDVAGEERLATDQDLAFFGDRDLASGQYPARGVQFLQRSTWGRRRDLRGHLGEAVAGVDRQPAGCGLVHQGTGHRAPAQEYGLERFEVGILPHQSQELGGYQRDVGSTEASDRLAYRGS